MKEKNNEKEIKFEDAMKRLEEIANELEKDDLTLDDSIAKFEEGMNLSKKCKQMLDSAEKKITILIGNKEDEFNIQKEE